MADAPTDEPPSHRSPPIAVIAAVVLVVVVLVAVAVAALRRDNTTTSSPPGSTAAPVIAPLTGLEDSSGASAHRCAVTVKIGNTPEARPQYGLDAADVVYEEIVEGGITRLAAVFQSQAPERAGPVRSVRVTDQSIVWPLRGVFAYSGGNPTAVAAIQAAPVTPVDESAAGDLMFRDPTRVAPHNLYARVDGLDGRCADPPPPPLFTYRDDATTTASPGTAAASVRIGFGAGYAVTWEWDAGSRRWLRAIFGGPDVGAGGQQVSTVNVVVMAVRYDTSGAVLTGSGPAWVLSDGKVVTGTWVRPDKPVPAQLLDATQHVIALTPGPSWVELLDRGQAVTTAP